MVGFLRFCKLLQPGSLCKRLASPHVKWGSCALIHRAVIRSTSKNLEKPVAKCLHAMSTQEMRLCLLFLLPGLSRTPSPWQIPALLSHPFPSGLPLSPRLTHFFPPPVIRWVLRAYWGLGPLQCSIGPCHQRTPHLAEREVSIEASKGDHPHTEKCGDNQLWGVLIMGCT